MNQTKSVAIYARVSTDKQKVDMRLAELREYVRRANWKIGYHEHSRVNIR
jgi:DNA invertase Pin-like site-specific DNA recombinase